MPAITESSGVAITVLADNHAAYGLDAEHGFSLWVETEGQKILFDTGQGEDMPRNAEALGIDIGAADRILLSHGHFDHTGNVPYALERAKRASLLLHPDALIDRYSIHAAPKPIGMPEKSRAAVYASAGTRCQWVRRPRAVSAGVWITGPEPRVTDFEDTGGPFFLDPAGTLSDPIPDDLSLCVHTAGGWVVCLGCCHAGVVNTLRHLAQEFGGSRILAVIGGMHLCHADAGRLERTAAALKEYDVPYLYPCHCTGEAATEFLRRHLPANVQSGFAGMKVAF